MYQTCLTCTSDLSANTEVEHLPIGRRLAFDSSVGRLWVVCPKCAKWNLVPFDQRLEAIDDCERLYEATVTRFATDNIGMAKSSSGVTLIRVGKPLGEEFASWRYGEGFRLRRKRTRLVTGMILVPTVATYMAIEGVRLLSASSAIGGIVAVIATGFGAVNGTNVGRFLAERRRYRLWVRHPRTQERIKLEHGDIKLATLLMRGGVLGLTLPFGKGDTRADLLFEGESGITTAGRVLGRLNATHGTPEEISQATIKTASLLRTVPGENLYGVASHLVTNPFATSYPLAAREPAISLALEMYANEDSERRFLTGELQFLERQWREAEELAKLADDLTLPD